MFDRRHQMVEENPDGWILRPKFPLLELRLPSYVDGITATRMGQWDHNARTFERFLPGRLQAISIALSPNNTELRFDGRTIMHGPTPIGTFAAPPGTRLSGRHHTAPDFVQFLFEPHGLATVLEDMSIDRHACELRPNYIPADVVLRRLSQRLAACFDMLPSLDTLFLESLIQSCLNQLIRSHATNERHRVVKGESLSPAMMRRVIEFIEENMQRSIRLDDLAKVAGVSRAHFARAFRNVVGVPPHVHLVQRRVERSLQLLHQSSMKIVDVAAATGFSDHAHMTRTYQRYLGVSPSTIRS